MKIAQLILSGLLVGFTFTAAASEGYDPWLLFILALVLSVLILTDSITENGRTRR